MEVFDLENNLTPLLGFYNFVPTSSPDYLLIGREEEETNPAWLIPSGVWGAGSLEKIAVKEEAKNSLQRKIHHYDQSFLVKAFILSLVFNYYF